MEASYEEVARRTAQRLSGTFDRNLPALTEGAIRAGAGDHQPERFMPGAIEIATLLVSVAQLAWSIWHDLEKDRREAGTSSDAAPLRQLLVRRLRVRIGQPAGLNAAQRDHLVEVVAEETDETVSSATGRH